MTIRMYYSDSYLKEFSGDVVEQCYVDNQPAVILDRTAFYPTSGGQPFDTGTLGSAQVLRVEEDSAGRLLHVLDSMLPVGPTTGVITWERRLDHMQQHTGQHILSQAFIRVAKAPTLSFHMGVETSTIDLELANPSTFVMAEAEEMASNIVFEDRPVQVLNVNPEGLAALGVRKESQRSGDIRVIDVDGFDRSPCGGTHVRRTGEIGMIAILDYERYKGGTRVEFVCGRRVLKTLRQDHEALKNLGRLYCAQLSDLPRLAEKFLQDRSALTRENARLRDQALEHEARELALQAERTSDFLLVKKGFPEHSLDDLKILAQKVTAHSGHLVILFSLQETAQAVIARSADLAGDCGTAVTTSTKRHGGKGGGRRELAQAGAIPAPALDMWLQEVESYFRNRA
jgi:alanyl-tRNA synthetase